jgi:predicted amidohydrolase YtcJ
VEDEQCGRILSMKLNSMGPALLGGHTDRTGLEPGMVADFVAIDRDAIEIEPEDLTSIAVLGTWIGGQRVWPDGEAELA